LPYNLSLNMEGVMAFVPDKPLFVQEGGRWKAPESGPTELTVLLPDLRLAAVADWEEDGKEIVRQPHWPILRARADQYRPPSGAARPVDLVIDDGTYEWFVFALSHEQLTLANLAGPLHLERQIPEPDQDTPLPKVGANDRSLWWVPRGHEISPSQCMAAARFRPKPHQPMNPSLVASMVLKNGNLSVTEFNRPGPKKPPTIWVFTKPWRSWHAMFKPKEQWNRAIGYELELVVPDLSGQVQLQFQASSQDSTEPLLFAEFEAGNGETVELYLSNLEPEDLLPEGRAPEQTSKQDPDYGEIYPLCAGNGGVGPIPRLDTGGSAGGDKRPCAGGILDGWR